MPKNPTLVVATQKEAWCFAGSNNNKRLALKGLRYMYYTYQNKEMAKLLIISL